MDWNQGRIKVEDCLSGRSALHPKSDAPGWGRKNHDLETTAAPTGAPRLLGRLRLLLGFCLLCGALADPTKGATLVQSYRPMNDGDRLEYAGGGATDTLVYRGDSTPGGYIMEDTMDNVFTSYTCTANQVVMTGVKLGWTRMSFSPAIVEVDEDLLAKGGTRRSTSKTRYSGVDVDVSVNVSVTSVGTVTVPAGTFQDCRLVTSSVTGTVPGVGSETLQAQNYVLAPNVGIIKVGLYNGDLAQIGWVELTGGTVGGRDVREYALAAAPSIVEQPTAQSVLVGGGAAFSVRASGKNLSFQWRKDGVLLVDGGRVAGATSASLTVNGVQTVDAGNYDVVVSNPAGSVTSIPARLTVHSGLGDSLRLVEYFYPINVGNQWVFKVTPSPGSFTNRVVQVESNAYPLECYTGRENPHSYFHNVVSLLHAHCNYRSGRLEDTRDLWREYYAVDGGWQYWGMDDVPQGEPRASDESLRIDGGILLDEIVRVGEKYSRSKDVYESGRFVGVGVFEFTVLAKEVVSVPAGVFQDCIHVRIAMGAGDETMIREVWMAKGVGFVKNCTVGSEGVAETHELTAYHVHAPAPTLTTQPADRTVAAGLTATFTVLADSLGALTYQWRKDGNNLVEGARISGATGPTLTIGGVEPDDAGAYSVVVNNAAGSITSANASLIVLVPPTLTQLPVDQTAVRNGAAVFTVAAEGTAPLTFQWKRNGVALSDGAGVSGSATATLTLSNVSTNDSGTKFAVSVSNTAGSALSPEVLLTVVLQDEAPRIVTQPAAQTVRQGQTATFVAKISGWPVPACRWRFNGVELVNDGRVSGADTPVLRVANITASDAGDYSLWVANVLGSEISQPATLTVALPPTIVTQPANTAAIPGGSAGFSVVAAGTAPLAYQWRKDGVDLPNQTQSTLVLSDVQPHQAGDYSVRVSNEAGSVESQSATLLVVNRALRAGGTNTVSAGTVDVPITLVSAGNENRVTLVFGVNSAAASVTSARLGEGATGASLVSSNQEGGLYWMDLALPTNQVFEAGLRELVVLRLSLSPSLTNEVLLPLEIGKQSAVWDAFGAALPFDVSNGALAVRGSVPGQESPSTGTGLYDGVVRVAIPPGGLAADRALMLLAHDLGLDSLGTPILLFNQDGTTNGVPYVLVRGPVAGGTVIDLTISFLSRDRVSTPSPRYELVEIPLPAAPTLLGAAIPITSVKYADETITLQFPTQTGKTYYIQYTPSLTDAAWRTAYPFVKGTGGWVIWRDAGPPNTESRPRQSVERFYQAMEVQ